MPLIDPVILKARLTEQAGRFDVDALDVCDSTSSELMRRAAAGAPAGTVIVADRQTAGRGRRGRQWLSAPEASLTFSLFWRFPGSATALGGLSLAVGIAVARAAEQLGAQGIRLKWPNDVLLETEGGFAKLAGILIELSSDRRGTQVFIGIGINLAPPALVDQVAAGLSQAMHGEADRHVVLATVLLELLALLDRFTVDGFAPLKSEWQARHAWQGRVVRVLGDDGGELLAGACAGVDDDGCLLVDGGRGIERVLVGDVSLRSA